MYMQFISLAFKFVRCFISNEPDVSRYGFSNKHVCLPINNELTISAIRLS